MSERVFLTVKVVPRAKINAIVGWRTLACDELAVRTTVAPEGGKANAAVIKMLAQSLGVPKTAIELVRGQSSRVKLVSFEMDEHDYRRWCDSLPAPKR
jgi:uncharacterized protein (TIGR00251 family)